MNAILFRVRICNKIVWLQCMQLFYRYCYLKIVKLMRERTLDNSSTKLQKQVTEQQHTESHMSRALQFLQAREPFEVQSSKGLFNLPRPGQNVPPVPAIPKPSWFLAVHLRDILSRIEMTKAKITSTFGEILKMVLPRRYYLK